MLAKFWTGLKKVITLKETVDSVAGTYALKPPLPAVGGGDGVGRVLSVGDQVTKFRPGDLVNLI